MKNFIRSAAVMCALTGLSEGASLRKAGKVTVQDAEDSLAAAWTGGISLSRIAEMEDALRATYKTLPKNSQGLVGFQATRYALHRLLLQRHGWFVTGLEPTDAAPPPWQQGEWVPSYLQGLLEQRLGTTGLDLRELASLAAVMEDLVRKEAGDRIEAAFRLHRLSSDEMVKGDKVQEVLSTYMMMFVGANFTGVTPDTLESSKQAFADRSSEWTTAEPWLHDILDKDDGVKSGQGLGMNKFMSMADDLSDRFSAFNDGECKALKSALVEVEDGTPGRILLEDFYRQGLVSHWLFREKASYLKEIGALDESNGKQRVIMANYIHARPNCLEASSLYAVCCRNQCEDLMQKLETTIAESEAEPKQILDLVTNMPSESVTSPQNMSSTMQRRLQEIADTHGGKVQLHGRLFAQWMHHVYPRECPFPHESGTTNPSTPDEWMKDGGEDIEVPLEERKEIVDKHVSTGKAESISKDGVHDLPWTDVEELLVQKDAQSGSRSLLKTLLLFGLPGLAIASQMHRLHPAKSRKLLPH